MKKLYVYSVQLFLFKYHHKSLPVVFSNFYTENTDIHTHFTRQQTLFHVPLFRTFQISRSIRRSGVSIYNYFIQHSNLNCSFITYKYHLKAFLLQNDIPFSYQITTIFYVNGNNLFQSLFISLSIQISGCLSFHVCFAMTSIVFNYFALVLVNFMSQTIFVAILYRSQYFNGYRTRGTNKLRLHPPSLLH